MRGKWGEISTVLTVLPRNWPGEREELKSCLLESQLLLMIKSTEIQNYLGFGVCGCVCVWAGTFPQGYKIRSRLAEGWWETVRQSWSRICAHCSGSAAKPGQGPKGKETKRINKYTGVFFFFFPEHFVFSSVTLWRAGEERSLHCGITGTWAEPPPRSCWPEQDGTGASWSGTVRVWAAPTPCVCCEFSPHLYSPLCITTHTHTHTVTGNKL